MNDSDLTKYIGDTIVRVSKLKLLTGEGLIDDDDGTVEITFLSGATLLCDNGPDDQSLRLDDHAWVDSFAGLLSPENEDYVRREGKFTMCDVSDKVPFVYLIGQKLWDVASITGVEGALYGVLLNVSGDLLAVYGNADEVHVRHLT